MHCCLEVSDNSTPLPRKSRYHSELTPTALAFRFDALWVNSPPERWLATLHKACTHLCGLPESPKKMPMLVFSRMLQITASWFA